MEISIEKGVDKIYDNDINDKQQLLQNNMLIVKEQVNKIQTILNNYNFKHEHQQFDSTNKSKNQSHNSRYLNPNNLNNDNSSDSSKSQKSNYQSTKKFIKSKIRNLDYRKSYEDINEITQINQYENNIDETIPEISNQYNVKTTQKDNVYGSAVNSEQDDYGNMPIKNQMDLDPFSNSINRSQFDPSSSMAVDVKIVDKTEKILNKYSINNCLQTKFKLSRKQMKELVYELENYPNSTIILDRDLDIVLCNKNFLKESGQIANELVSKNMSIFIDNEMIDYLKKSVQDKINLDDTTHKFNLDIINKDDSMQSYTIKLESIKIYIGLELIILQMDKCKQFENKYTIDPRNIQQLIYSSMMFSIIILLLFWIPQDLAFSDQQSETINRISDIQLTILFVFDIIMNFFLAQEIEEDVQEFKLELVSINYVKSQFIIDLISTIPFDAFINSDHTIDSNILKSIRASKFFRLIKLLRLSKLFSIFSAKNLKNNPIGQQVQDFQKSNSGLIELFIQNMYILVFAHFYTCLQYQIKTSQNVIPETDFLMEYYGISFVTDINSTEYNPETVGQLNLDIQMLILSENVKTALGLAVIRPQTRTEILMNLTWMFVGLSLFGQGIGNISSFINASNKVDQQKNEIVSYFNELCEDNDVNAEMMKLLTDDINQQFRNQNEIQFYEQAKVLSKPVLMKLESNLLTQFVTSFPLLEQLSLNGARLLKNLARFKSESVDIVKGSNVDKALFITKGVLKVYNDEMQLANEQKAGEIFGMSQFKKYFISKQDIDIDIQFGKVEKKNNKRKKSQFDIDQSLNIIQKDQKFQILRQKQNEDMPLRANNILKIQQEEDTFEIKQNNNLSASSDIEQFEINQKNLETILLNDSATFFQIWEQNMQSQEKITESEQRESLSTVRQFNSHLQPGLIVLEDGQLQDMNTALMDGEPRFKELIGTNILDIFYIQTFTGQRKADTLADITQGQYQVYFDHMYRRAAVTVIKKQFKLLARTEDFMDQSVKVDSHQFSLKKSMLKTYILQMELMSNNEDNDNQYE